MHLQSTYKTSPNWSSVH